MATSISDTKFAALKNKLRELFELDKSDLDFGIYRIMAARNKEVTAFLDRELKDTVRDVLQEHSTGQSTQLQTDLDKAIEGAKALGMDPESVPKVQELREKLKSAGGGSVQELEADIYNHLLAFFSRYYNEGDFISKRYYKGDTYAIPYNGEEVTLHWANKDQYYIKSGEWHKDYRFRVDGRTVRFNLVEATQESNSNKESDAEKRRFILDDKSPIRETEAELTFHFQYRVPTEAEKRRVSDAEVTRIFGGKYDASTSRTKGDEREQFSADAEKRGVESVSDDWQAILSKVIETEPGRSATPTKPNRTVLGRHLEHFTARNAFDYFIHKDLGGFFKRELNFYIKNEVVRLDDLELLDNNHLANVQGKVKAIRRIATRLIDFLASIETFQKKLWLKKKFVLNTNWLVTVDRIPEKLRDEVAKNATQWKEWEVLGFRPSTTTAVGGRLYEAVWGSQEYLNSNTSLVVDTRHFTSEFTSNLLASSEVLAGSNSLDAATTGLLLHGENSGALSLLQARYASDIHCIYIDPPYNTGDDGFPYKDGFFVSSWFAMISDRAERAASLLSDAGLFFLQIGDDEAARSRLALETVFSTRKNSVVVRRGVKNVQAQFDDIERLNQGHDTIHICAKRSGTRLPHLYQRLPDGKPGKWDTFWRGVDRPTMRYLLFGQNPKTGQWRWEPGRAKRAAANFDNYLTHEAGSKSLDEWYAENLQSGVDLDFVRLNSDGVVQYYVPPQSYRLVSDNWLDIPATGTVTDFPHEKSLALMSRIIEWICPDNGVVLDYFAGSGTTGHAVIQMNRSSELKRRFIVVEMGAYFTDTLRPRIIRALFCQNWRGNEPDSFNDGLSGLVKYSAIESYEDAINHLPATDGKLLTDEAGTNAHSLIEYALDLELGPQLLNLSAFRDPWNYRIDAQLAGENSSRPQQVDLVDTFNYLIGLRVHEYGSIERYEADFKRLSHEGELGRLIVDGRVRRSASGRFVFQRVEGEFRDGTRVLVIWRKLTEDPEQDAAVLDAWIARHREDTKQRSQHRDYHQIYINGPVTLPQPTQELRTVLPIEQSFKDRMFADTEDV